MADYEDIILPEPDVLRKKYRDLRTISNMDQCLALEDFLLDTTDNFEKVCESYADVGENVDDPDIVADNYERYRKYSGALLGIADGLYEKTKKIAYEELMAQNASKDPKQKTVQSDRDILVRGSTAVLSALRTRIKSHDSTLTSRAIRQNGGGGKRRYD